MILIDRSEAGLESSEWREKLIQHWTLLESLAQRRFGRSNLADEALLFVQQTLQEKDWRRLRAFRGGSGFKTFLVQVVHRLLEDFARRKFGRDRTPEWVKAQGALWEEVYRLLCIEKMPGKDAMEYLSNSAPGGRSSEVVEYAVAVILDRIPDCGLQKGEATVAPELLDERDFSRSELHHMTPEDLVAAVEKACLLDAVACFMASEDAATQDSDHGAETAPHILRFVEKLRAHVRLSPEERLFLRMIYHDGMTVSKAGRLLRMDTNQAHRKLRRLLDQLRASFKKSGLDRELKVLLLEDPEMYHGW